jgi:hypothetical protein
VVQGLEVVLLILLPPDFVETLKYREEFHNNKYRKRNAALTRTRGTEQSIGYGLDKQGSKF